MRNRADEGRESRGDPAPGLDVGLDQHQRAEGALTMGQWQRVLMAELDGPRKRGLVLQVLAAS